MQQNETQGGWCETRHVFVFVLIGHMRPRYEVHLFFCAPPIDLAAHMSAVHDIALRNALTVVFARFPLYQLPHQPLRSQLLPPGKLELRSLAV